MTPVLQVRDYRLLRQLFDRLNGSKVLGQKALAQGQGWRLRFERDENDTAGITAAFAIAFRINDAAAEERTLVLAGDYRPDGHCLALDSPIGVALLGYQAGDVINAEWRSECPDPITILDVRNPSPPAMRRGGVIVPFPGRTNNSLEDSHAPE